MANEAVKVEGPYQVHDFTVADGTTISAMTLCKMAEPRTASATAVGDSATVFAGIAATDKVASNGKTELGLYTKGIFKLTAAAAGAGISDGTIVTISGANLIRAAVAAELLTGAVIGKALEDIADGTTGEVSVGEVV